MSEKEPRRSLLPLEHELGERVGWFIRLRWLAGASVLVSASVCRWALGWPLSWAVDAIGLVVLLYNGLFAFQMHRRERPGEPAAAAAWSGLAKAQIAADLSALTVLLHFTGGLYSPLLPFTVIHVMLGSLLLRRRAVFLQAGLACALISGLALTERMSWFTAQRLGGLLPDAATVPLAGYLLLFAGFVVFLLVIAVLASTMGYALRRREQQLLRVQAELEQACRRLEEIDLAKASYTQMVTHELRSPAAAILSVLEVVRQGYAGELPGRAREMIERCVRRAEVLVELINQMLDLARNRVELTPERTQAVSVGSLLQQMQEAYLTPAEVKGTLLVVEPLTRPLAVCGDPNELNKLFSNLVSNAVKYTLQGGEVHLRAWSEGEKVVLEVRDTGIGVPQREQGQLFGPFFRATNARKQVTCYGTGLGLAIVKRIVDAHHGSLRFSSEEGRGTTFWIELPIAQLPIEPSPAPPAVGTPSAAPSSMAPSSVADRSSLPA